MATSRTLDARAYKEGKWWMVSIPEIDGLTQAKTIEKVPAMAADLAAIILEVPAENVEIKVSYTLDEQATEANALWVEAQEQLAAAKTTAENRLAELAQTLKEQGYTIRDIGALTGYSFQRIAQILS